MRVGITLPQFRDDAEPALAVARHAEKAGLDGVFVFDHLWPLGAPERPALHSLVLLGALAAETERAVLGTLVSRVGLFPDAVLVHAFESLHRMVGDRLVAGLGTGDSHNKAENLAYGIPFPPKRERLARLERCLVELSARGITAWAGGLSGEVRDVAVRTGAAWNLWGVGIGEVASRGAGVAGGVTWGGQVLVGRDSAAAAGLLARHGSRPGLVHGSVDDLAGFLGGLAAAGATWAVCAPLVVDEEAVEVVAAAANQARGSAPAE